MSYLGCNQFKEAIQDLESALAIQPDNALFKTELQRAKKQLAESNRRTKSALQNMFSKGGLYGEKPNVVSLDFSEDDPTVYFDVKQGEEEFGRIEMRLYKHIVGEWEWWW